MAQTKGHSDRLARTAGATPATWGSLEESSCVSNFSLDVVTNAAYIGDIEANNPHRRAQMTLTERAAAALDATHDYDGRGPRTFQARRRVAEWLDTGRGRRTSIAMDVAWLMSVAA